MEEREKERDTGRGWEKRERERVNGGEGRLYRINAIFISFFLLKT